MIALLSGQQENRTENQQVVSNLFPNKFVQNGCSSLDWSATLIRMQPATEGPEEASSQHRMWGKGKQWPGHVRLECRKSPAE